MQKMFRGIVGFALTGFLAMAIQPAFAADNKAENQLVGIKLWRGFKDVLAKHGQPTRIEIGAVSGPSVAGQVGGGGEMGGGMMGRGGMMGGPMMGGPMMGGGKFGGMMGGGLPGVSGMNSGMMMGGRGPSGPTAGSMMGSGGMSAMMGARMGGGMGRAGKGDAGEGDNLVGAPMSGGPAMGGFGLAGGGLGGSPSIVSGTAEGEITWVYDRPGALTYMFLFNKDGRVIQIQEYGYSGGGPTGAGIKLGDPVSRVYSIYGWAGNSSKSGNQLTMDFSQKHHVAFQLLDQGKGPKVIGITLAITERGQIPGQAGE